MTHASTRVELLDLLPQVGGRFGLSRTLIDHLCHLVRWTKNLDWEPGNRAVVYASVTTIARNCGVTERQILNRERAIADALGLSMAVTANRRRFGLRDPEHGHILRAYGFELTGLRSLLPALRAAKAEIDAENARWRALRRVLSELRGQIRRLVAGLMAAGRAAVLDDLAAGLRQLAERVRAQTPLGELERRIAVAERLRRSLEAAALGAAGKSCARAVKISARAEENFRPIQSQTDPQPGDKSPGGRPTEDNRQAMEGRSGPDLARQGAVTRGGPVAPESTGETTGAGRIGVGLALRAGSERFRDEVRRRTPAGRAPSAAEVIAAATAALPRLGIVPEAWAEAVAILGPWPAALCILLIERGAGRGDVHRPGGYLRAMARRALVGGLHLERGVFAAQHVPSRDLQ